jgi:uncharacterized protein YceH (UPF0502 family)
MLQPLSQIEARILGVLIEKAKTTPDAYPLTVNSLTAGCNQKTSREPVMSISESEVQGALEDLRSRTLIMESYGASGRVLRYAHNFAKVYDVPAASVDLLAILMLRGPQTASELRANCERLHRFADASSVEAFLEELAARDSGAMVLKLPRQPGAREQRWTHLLSGMPTAESISAGFAAKPSALASDLEARIERLEQEVAELRAALARQAAE